MRASPRYQSADEKRGRHPRVLAQRYLPVLIDAQSSAVAPERKVHVFPCLCLPLQLHSVFEVEAQQAECIEHVEGARPQKAGDLDGVVRRLTQPLETRRALPSLLSIRAVRMHSG